MAPLKQILLDPLHLLLTDPYIFIGLLVVVGIIFYYSSRPKDVDLPLRIMNKRLIGTVRSLNDQLASSKVANDQLRAECQKWQVLGKEYESKFSSIEKELKRYSLYIHELESKLLHKRLLRR